MTPDRRWAAHHTTRRPRGAMLYTPAQRRALHLVQAAREDAWADQAQAKLDLVDPWSLRARQLRGIVATHRRRAEQRRQLAAAEPVLTAV